MLIFLSTCKHKGEQNAQVFQSIIKGDHRNNTDYVVGFKGLYSNVYES